MEANSSGILPVAAPGLFGAPSAFPVATAADRFKAHVVDAWVACAIFYGYGILTTPAVKGFHRYDGNALLIGLLLTGLYWPLMECSPLQGTLGKRLFGLKVVTLTGNRIGPGRAMVRAAVKCVTFFTCGGPLWFLGVVLSRCNQAPHDVIARTLVVRIG